MGNDGTGLSSQSIPPDDDPRLEIRKAGREVIEALIRLAGRARWTNSRIPQLHATLSADEKHLPKTEWVFQGLDIPASNPRKFAGWIRLLSLPDDSYVGLVSDTARIFQPDHALRLHRILGALGVIQHSPALLQNFRELSDRRDFLRNAAKIIDDYSGRASGEEEIARPDERLHGRAASQVVDQADNLRLTDPRIAGIHERRGADFVRGLWANVEIDSFREREADLQFLRRFLEARDDRDRIAPVAWALVTGDGGDGKTRLALQFFRELETQGYRYGFLRLEDLEPIRSWRPSRRTFIVVDYVAQAATQVRRLLTDLINSSYNHKFDFSVRVLLLERRSSDADWLKGFLSPDRDGNSIIANLYNEPKTRVNYPVSPLSEAALLQIMRGRLGQQPLDDESLLAAVYRVDPRRLDIDGQYIRAPRPLFAAATGQAIAELAREKRELHAVVQKLEQKEVLSRIIERERVHFWTNGNASDPVLEKHRLGLHENLLLVSTITLDLPRSALGTISQAARHLLPSAETLDEDRLERMSVTDSPAVFKRLEPDILGEYFVLASLLQRSETDRQALIDAALSSGPETAPVFMIRCAMDFPALYRKLNFLKPSRNCQQANATLAFILAVGALVTSSAALSEDEAASLVLSAENIAEGSEDPAHTEATARMLYNLAFRVSIHSPAESIEKYDALIRRYETSIDPLIEEHVATALLNKGVMLDRLGRDHEALAVYSDLLQRFDKASDPSIRDCVEQASFNTGNALFRLKRFDAARIAWDSFLERYREPSSRIERERRLYVLRNKIALICKINQQPHTAKIQLGEIIASYLNQIDLRTRVAATLMHVGMMLMSINSQEEAFDAFDAVVHVYEQFVRGNSHESTQREIHLITAAELSEDPFHPTPFDFPDIAATALHTKGKSLTEMKRYAEAEKVYEKWQQLFDEPKRLVTATQTINKSAARWEGMLAEALGHRGFLLERVGDYQGSARVFADLISRFSSTQREDLKVYVLHAVVDQGIAHSRLGQVEEAIALWHEVPSPGHHSARIVEAEIRAGVLEAMGLFIVGRNKQAERVFQIIIIGFFERVYGNAVPQEFKDAYLRAIVQGISICDDFIDRFTGAENSVARDYAAGAVLAKVKALMYSGSGQLAISACDEYIMRYGAAQDVILQSLVGQLKFHKTSLLRG